MNGNELSGNELSENELGKLRTMNAVASGVHLFNALVPLVYILWKKGGDFSTPAIRTNLTYTKTYPVGPNETKTEVVDIAEQWNALLIFLLITFSGVTAIFHAGIALSGNLYGRMIKGRNNYLRWMEYALTSTIMLVIIAFSVGLQDIALIMVLSVLNILMNLSGQVVESLDSTGGNENRTNSNLVLLVGWLLWAVIWGVLSTQFGVVVSENVDQVPAFVWVAFLGLLFLFSTFGIVHFVNHVKRPTYWKVDMWYIILSFVAKSLLVYTLFAGAIARGDEN